MPPTSVSGTKRSIEQVLETWNKATEPFVYFSNKECNGVKHSKAKNLKKQGRKICRPWDHKAFLERVSTFSIGTWFAKPKIIGTLECARHGWINTQPDQLKCERCDAILCFQLDPKLSQEGIERVSKKFADQLVAGHFDNCPWKDCICPQSFVKLPVATPQQTLDMIVERFHKTIPYTILPSIKKALGSIEIVPEVQATIKMEIGHKDLSVIIDQVLSKKSAYVSIPDRKVLETILLLTIHGWKLDKDICVITCDYCNRKVNLTVSPDTAPSTKTINPITEHRWFCPCVNASNEQVVEEEALGSKEAWTFSQLPGWIQYARSLVFLDEASSIRPEKKITPSEALETVCSILEINE